MCFVLPRLHLHSQFVHSLADFGPSFLYCNSGFEFRAYRKYCISESEAPCSTRNGEPMGFQSNRLDAQSLLLFQGTTRCHCWNEPGAKIEEQAQRSAWY